MHNNKDLQYKKQRKNALEVLKQWEVELNLNKELDKSPDLRKVKVKCEEFK